MKKMNKDKKIEIISFCNNNELRLIVGDSGSGVDSDIKNKIFDPFFSTKKYGTGIGLSLCHRIIKDHNGILGVASSRWGGAEFVIVLPVKKTVTEITIQ